VIFALALIFLVSTVAFLVLPIQLPLTGASGSNVGTPTVTITLYAGEISGTRYGFGLSPNNITSPGPTFYFNTTDIVKITVVNSGQMPHAFACVNAPRTGATVLFGATIASGSNPIPPGESGSVTFHPNTVSNQYYYICPVPGHAELGMWGTMVVSQG
jgi:plastocyanin